MALAFVRLAHGVRAEEAWSAGAHATVGVGVRHTIGSCVPRAQEASCRYLAACSLNLAPI